ncbi:aromatic-ring-hydroxylating dioxygenase subunit beta [Azotobacter vinelandii]
MNTLELVTLEEERAVQAFLLREARLLDEDRWDDWLLMVSERIHYWMPGIENRRREDARGASTPNTWPSSTTATANCSAGWRASSSRRPGRRTRRRATCT